MTAAAVRRRLLLGMTVLACGPAAARAQAADSIGSATMLPDGTIVLRLRATSGGGMVGDGQFSYPPNHTQYEMIRRHLGGISPGETKPVPPFPQR